MFIVLVVLSIVHAQATYHVVGIVSCNAGMDWIPAHTGKAYIWDSAMGGSKLDSCCLDGNSEYHFYMPNGTYYVSIVECGIYVGFSIPHSFKLYSSSSRTMVKVLNAEARVNIQLNWIYDNYGIDDYPFPCPAYYNQ